MRIGRNEIIEELTEHIRKSGGNPDEWSVGMARDFDFTDQSQIQDLSKDRASMAGLAYREAHTPYAAADAVEYLVDAFGLKRDSAPGTGKIVFVYRTAAAPHLEKPRDVQFIS